jgi:ADP-glucose pyrophosphorylase
VVEAGCQISGSVIQNSIIEKEARVEDVILRDSMIGQYAQVEGGSTSINLGDHSSIAF